MATHQRIVIGTRPRRGMVLPVVIFALIIMSVVAIVAFRTAADERRASLSFRESTRAQDAAEAGLQQALGLWPKAAVAALNPGDSLDQGWTALPDRSSFRIVIHRVDKGGLQAYDVISQSRREGGLAAGNTVTQMVFGVPTFKWAMFAQGNITISGAPTGTDGYNSAAGPYNAATADSTGSIDANGNIIWNNGTVLGNVTTAGTISGSPGTATGTVTQGAPAQPAMPTLTCPAGGYTPNANVPGGPGITYSSVTGILTVTGNKNLTLTAPPTQYLFHQILLAGNSTLTVTGGGQHMDIYVDDSLSFTGGGIVNTGGKPTDVGLWSCGPSVKAWTFAGGAAAYFAIYAPTHPLLISGGADLFGAAIGASISIAGGSKFHYDEGLLNAASANLRTGRGSWSQFP